jgi:ketosteroid isomerase-like protein
MSEERIATLMHAMEAFNRGDSSGPIAISTPDVEWGAIGAFPGVERRYRGPQGIQEWMDAIRSAWEAFEVSVDEVLYDERDLLVTAELLRGRGRSSGAEVQMRIFAVYRFEREKVRRREAFTERNDALEAAGLSE